MAPGMIAVKGQRASIAQGWHEKTEVFKGRLQKMGLLGCGCHALRMHRMRNELGVALCGNGVCRLLEEGNRG